MKFEIDLSDIKAMSLNNYQKYTTRGKFVSKYKPPSSKKFDSKANSELDKFKSVFNKFNTEYIDNKHCVVANFVFSMPIFLKNGSRIAKTSGDLDNLFKPIIDLLFKRLDADDSAIVEINAIKIHSDIPSIKISLHLKDLSSIK